VAQDEVATAAREGEADRYLAALLAPDTVQADLVAIAAFAAEMRRIPGLVREPMMGEIRLQWWRDTIDGFGTGASTASHGALAAALERAAGRHALARPMLQAMTEARAFDLYDDPMPDEASFRGYLAKTEATPFALALKICGADDVPTALADHAGRAYGTARLLADLPSWLAKGRCPLPVTYLAEAGCDVDDLRAGGQNAGSGRVFDRLVADIESDARAAATMARQLARGQRLAVLPVATIPTYLRALHWARRGPLQTAIDVSGLRRITRIARAHWLGL
jgi:15-cis-phytoene synthase